MRGDLSENTDLKSIPCHIEYLYNTVYDPLLNTITCFFIFKS